MLKISVKRHVLNVLYSIQQHDTPKSRASSTSRAVFLKSREKQGSGSKSREKQEKQGHWSACQWHNLNNFGRGPLILYTKYKSSGPHSFGQDFCILEIYFSYPEAYLSNPLKRFERDYSCEDWSKSNVRFQRFLS